MTVKTGTLNLMTGVITEDEKPDFPTYEAQTSDGNVYAADTEETEASSESEEKIRVREAAEPTRRPAISLFAVVGFLLVAVMMVMMLMTNISLTEANAENIALQQQLSALEEEGRKLDSEYKAAFNMTEVGEYAENVLGMVKGNEDQVEYLNIQSNDMAVVYKASAEPEEKNGFMSFLTSLVSYFK